MMLTYDITRADTFDDLQHWLDEVVMHSGPDIIVMLIGNQKDREEHREVPLEKAEAFRAKHNIPFFIETSAKSGENVD